MGTHRSIPVIDTPADLRGGVTREVADAMRSGRVRYVGFTEARPSPSRPA
jgi:hypothetical protein